MQIECLKQNRNLGISYKRNLFPMPSSLHQENVEGNKAILREDCKLHKKHMTLALIFKVQFIQMHWTFSNGAERAEGG